MKVLRLVLALASVLSLPAAETFEDLAFGIVPRQSEAASCGYAVMAGLLNLPENKGSPRPPGALSPVTERYLLERYGGDRPVGDRAPLSMLEMIGILADFGLGAVPLKLDPGLLGAFLEAAPSLVIHYDRPVSHFVLGLGAEAGSLTVADPECGLVSMSRHEMAGRASGNVLLPLSGPRLGGREESALSAAIRDSKGIRSTLAARARGLGAIPAPREQAGEALQREAGISIASSGAEVGEAEILPSAFFRLEWPASNSLTLAGKIGLRREPGPARPDLLELSPGIEWHRENEAGNRSFGLALLIAARLGRSRTSAGPTEGNRVSSGNPDSFGLESLLRFRYSALANPLLLTGTAGIKANFSDSSPTKQEPGRKKALSLAFPSELSALCAFSPSMTGTAGLEQEFRFPFDGQDRMEWKASLVLETGIPMKGVLLCAGARIRLDFNAKTRGEVLFSVVF